MDNREKKKTAENAAFFFLQNWKKHLYLQKNIYNMEALSKTDLSAINFYWKFLQFIPENVKLGLAAKLTTSVLEDTTAAEPEKEPDDYTARMLDKFWGAWVGDETADEVMKNIKLNVKSRNPINLDL